MQRHVIRARLLCAALLYSLTGCAGMPAEPVLRSASYRLAEHQFAALGSAVSVRYDRFSDSRCPTGARCIWAGKVSYHFTLTSEAGSESFALDHDGERYAAKSLAGVSFGVSFAGLQGHPVAEHALVLLVIVAAGAGAGPDAAALDGAPAAPRRALQVSRDGQVD